MFMTEAQHLARRGEQHVWHSFHWIFTKVIAAMMDSFGHNVRNVKCVLLTLSQLQGNCKDLGQSHLRGNFQEISALTNYEHNVKETQGMIKITRNPLVEIKVCRPSHLDTTFLISFLNLPWTIKSGKSIMVWASLFR